jgi:hypothetical protein
MKITIDNAGLGPLAVLYELYYACKRQVKLEQEKLDKYVAIFGHDEAMAYVLISEDVMYFKSLAEEYKQGIKFLKSNLK